MSHPKPRGQLMRRREVIGLLGGAVAWPFAARAQQKTGLRIGMLGWTSAGGATRYLDALAPGLEEAGFVENQNNGIQDRWGPCRHGLLAGLAPDPVNQQ